MKESTIPPSSRRARLSSTCLCGSSAAQRTEIHSRYHALHQLELSWLLDYLVGVHHKALERIGTERGADRHVGGITPARHEDAADARRVVTGVEGVPATAEIDLEPGAEIHGIGIGDNSDIAEIAGAITRRDVHAAAKRDREMREVAADPAALKRHSRCGPGSGGVLIAEAHNRRNVIADRLYAWPPRRRLAE